MKIKIAARKSDLARLQAYSVGKALLAAHPHLEIDYQFRESLGDKNLTVPLWQIPERGVFTEDFLADLLENRADLIVHSWKDLPTEKRQKVEILATMPRADQRDLLLMRKDAGKNLRILTSSPRRTYSLDRFLRPLLPFTVENLDTIPVRGNIPTRLQKLMQGEGDALLVAKAALDRLLAAPEEEFREVQEKIRAILKEMRWMVLPLTYFPTAPAQGALAIEGRSDRPELKKILAAIHCPQTMKAVEEERRRFAAFGGGCHQKIGLSILPHERFGSVCFFSGQIDSGEQRHEIFLEQAPVSVGKKRWPESPTALFSREPIRGVKNPGTNLYVSRAEALPEDWLPSKLLWCAGLESWKKLAARNIWVNGCDEGLGEKMPTFSEQGTWTKLSHDQSENTGAFPILATYALKPIPVEIPSDTEECFWMSESAFNRAIELFPWLFNVRHSAGAGYSARAIESRLGKAVDVYLHYRHWKTGKTL